jgi:hypothetical protein
MTSAITIAKAASSIVTGQLFEDELQHRLLHPQRLAEVAVQDALDPVQIADGKRFVEVHLLAEVRDDVRIAVFAGEDDRGVARQQLLQAEDQHRHEDQCRDDRADAANEVGEHLRGVCSVGFPASQSCDRSGHQRAS